MVQLRSANNRKKGSLDFVGPKPAEVGSLDSDWPTKEKTGSLEKTRSLDSDRPIIVKEGYLDFDSQQSYKS